MRKWGAASCSAVRASILLLGQCSEYLYVAFQHLSPHVQPELVELIWRSVARVDEMFPDFVLPNLPPSAFVISGLVSANTSPPFVRRISSAPVVMLPHWLLPPIWSLQPLVSYRSKEVVPLQQLVGEFREGKTVTCLTVQTLLYRIFRHHIVHGDVLTHFTGKIRKVKFFIQS